MTAPRFDAVARSLQIALEDWFAQRGGASGDAMAITVASNSTLLEGRAGPLRAMLARRGLASLEGRRVIDLGCGFGALSVNLAWHGAQVVGIDRNERLFAVGETVAREHHLDVLLAPGRMEDLRAGDAEFDVALMNNTLCYLIDSPARQRAMGEAFRVLRSGGILLVREPNGAHPVDHFSGMPLLPLLPPKVASRLAARSDRPRPQIRLVSPAALRRGLASAGFAHVRQEPARGGAVAWLARPVARYQHFTAQRP